MAGVVQRFKRHPAGEGRVTDHGDDLSDHGLSQKWSMYDIITRTPLIVWAPGRYQGGRTVDALVQQFDIGPESSDGLGLQLAHDFATQLGGRLEVAVGDEGHGTRIHARCRPRRPARAAAP